MRQTNRKCKKCKQHTLSTPCSYMLYKMQNVLNEIKTQYKKKRYSNKVWKNYALLKDFCLLWRFLYKKSNYWVGGIISLIFNSWATVIFKIYGMTNIQSLVLNNFWITNLNIFIFVLKTSLVCISYSLSVRCKPKMEKIVF